MGSCTPFSLMGNRYMSKVTWLVRRRVKSNDQFSALVTTPYTRLCLILGRKSNTDPGLASKSESWCLWLEEQKEERQRKETNECKVTLAQAVTFPPRHTPSQLHDIQSIKKKILTSGRKNISLKENRFPAKVSPCPLISPLVPQGHTSATVLGHLPLGDHYDESELEF